MPPHRITRAELAIAQVPFGAALSTSSMTGISTSEMSASDHPHLAESSPRGRSCRPAQELPTGKVTLS